MDAWQEALLIVFAAIWVMAALFKSLWAFERVRTRQEFFTVLVLDVVVWPVGLFLKFVRWYLRLQ